MKRKITLALLLLLVTLTFSGCFEDNFNKLGEDIFVDISWEKVVQIVKDTPETERYQGYFMYIPKLADTVNFLSVERYAYLKEVKNPKKVVEEMTDKLLEDGFTIAAYEYEDRFVDKRKPFSTFFGKKEEKGKEVIEPGKDFYSKVILYKKLDEPTSEGEFCTVSLDFFEYKFTLSHNVCIITDVITEEALNKKISTKSD